MAASCAMPFASLLHELLFHSANRKPHAPALSQGERLWSYGELAATTEAFSVHLSTLQWVAQARVAIFLEKRAEAVASCFGTAAAGGIFVPVNPLLKPEQVGFIVKDCSAHVLVTSVQRLELLSAVLTTCPSLKHVIVVDAPSGPALPSLPGVTLHRWPQGDAGEARASPSIARVIDTDIVSILYTSGSTGRPKGVVLSHRNMVAGAQSVASYLGNHEDDVLLAVLPLSFDAGFSQLTTAFSVGAKVALLNYLLPRDVLKAMQRERVTGLTAVPPLYIQLAQLDWPSGLDEHLRYFANTGGRMPRQTLDALRQRVPKSQPFLMYGLTEAFRSTYLPPSEVDRRPDSIGKAIPNAEILVLREDGTPCDVDEPGELVHRGPLVGQGYWGDAEKTAERYKPLPPRLTGLVLPELAVFSGDTVRRDADGFLYFIGRRDEMIKTSGYRVSPTEVEEAAYATQMVGECAAFGQDDDTLGQSIVLVVTAPASAPGAGQDLGQGVDVQALLAALKQRLPAYMVPSHISVSKLPLPRNPNGKIDRKQLALAWHESSMNKDTREPV